MYYGCNSYNRAAIVEYDLWVNLSEVEEIHPKRNKFTTGVKIKATLESNFVTAL